MTIEKIINEIYPLTSEIRHCRYKKQRWEQKRARLREMIEAYKRGDIVSFSASPGSGIVISADVDEHVKKRLKEMDN